MSVIILPPTIKITVVYASVISRLRKTFFSYKPKKVLTLSIIFLANEDRYINKENRGVRNIHPDDGSFYILKEYRYISQTSKIIYLLITGAEKNKDKCDNLA